MKEHFVPDAREIAAPPYRALLSEREVDRWREEFPILQNAVHLGSCSQGAQSRRVRAALEGYLDNWLTAGMDWDGWVEEVSRAR